MGPSSASSRRAQADLALVAARRICTSAGQLVTFDGRTDVLRRRTIARRADCPLCGLGARGPHPNASNPTRYVSPACAG